jgi:molybdopterin/thiamine biosynthesis adenylyltransferase
MARRVAAALALDGFRPRVRSGGLSFTGSVQVRGKAVAMRLEYDGLEFSRTPRVIIEDPDALGAGVLPHLEEDNSLCAVDPRQFVPDRYGADQQARGIVRRVAEVLDQGLGPSAAEEIATEFPRHWGGRLLRVEFGPFDGYGEAYEAPDGGFQIRRTEGPVQLPKLGAVVLATPRLTFLRGQRRPTNLDELLVWAETQQTGLAERVLAGLAAVAPLDPYVVLHAPNGIAAFQLEVSSRGTHTMTAIKRPAAWETLVRGAFGKRLPIRRLQGLRVDTEYVIGTNSKTGTAPLSGRRIILVGCGAVGSFLSTALAQLGAGAGGGNLTLIDSETLANRNTARHRLGVEWVGEPKASACKKVIDQGFPGLSITALDKSVDQFRQRIEAADLVVDGTGEQAVGEMLNEWRIQQGAAPALLHVWIEGNGAAAVSYFSSDAAFGCYRCLQPDLLSPPRFPVLRPDADTALVTACGEAPFSPYGPAAPLTASGLASHHIVDWAQGNARPLLRVVRLSYTDTQERRPTNPSKSPGCPACG